MRVLVTGSSKWDERNVGVIQDRLATLPAETTIIHGCGMGVDTFAGRAAKTLGFEIEEYPPDFEQYGKEATSKRNIQMTEAEPDVCIAFWDGKSYGTFHTMYNALIRGIPIDVVMQPVAVTRYEHRQLELTPGGV